MGTVQIAMCIARYSAVFPISSLINFVSRARNGRRLGGGVRNTSRGAEEIPHSYQMVLFWAGLRGAVGVALAEGMRGEHAVALRTTVLVSVVLTVVVFGGTIGRMLEVVGVRTGVIDEDGDDETDEEEEYRLLENDLERRHLKKRSLALGTPGTSHHFASLGTYSHSSGNSSFPDAAVDPRRSRGGGGSVRGSLPPSELSSDSDGEVLPSVSASVSESGVGDGKVEGGGIGGVWTALDEQYLLPVFSNATANRNALNRKSATKAKRTSHNGSGGGGGAADDSGDLASSGHSSPYANEAVGAKSLGDVVSALVAPSHPSAPANSLPTPYLSYATPNSPFPSVDMTAGSSAGARSASSRARGGSHTPTQSLSSAASPVQPFGSGSSRRSSIRGQSPGGGEGER